MEANGVRRFVCETSLGIGDSAWRMGLYYSLFTIPVILPFYFWDKTRQERVNRRQQCGVGGGATWGADQLRRNEVEFVMGAG